MRAQGFSSQLDQYRVLRELGEGGTSRVMLAEHKSTKERFALKIINTKRVDQLERTLHEISLQERCKSCPNVVRFKEQFMHGSAMHCIVMEYMSSGDLQQYLQRRNFKPLSMATVRQITVQICAALKYLHMR